MLSPRRRRTSHSLSIRRELRRTKICHGPMESCRIQAVVRGGANCSKVIQSPRETDSVIRAGVHPAGQTASTTRARGLSARTAATSSSKRFL